MPRYGVPLSQRSCAGDPGEWYSDGDQRTPCQPVRYVRRTDFFAGGFGLFFGGAVGAAAGVYGTL